MSTVAEVEAEAKEVQTWVREVQCSRFRHTSSKAHTDACFLPAGSDLSFQARQELISARTFLMSALGSINDRLGDAR